MTPLSTLIKSFEQYAYGQNYAVAFGNLVDYFLIPFKHYGNQQEQQHAIEMLQSNSKKETLVNLLTQIGEMAEGFCDPLGELYETLISKGQHGQFFTPDPIASFMASIAGLESLKDEQTVLDPACGSGRMLLAAAKINRHLRFYGADIDLLCCKMALVNMLLNSLTGEIAHMDIISSTFHRGYKTSTIIRDGYHYPYYVEFTDKEQSYIWLRPVEQPANSKVGFDKPFEPPKFTPVQGVQGKLF